MSGWEKTRFPKWGVAALLAATLAVGCSRDGMLTLRVSSCGDVKENAILLGLIRDFQAGHPGVKVELLQVPYNDYVSKLLTQVAGGNAPDVVFTGVEWVADFCWRGVLEPLNDYFQGDPAFPVEDFYPEILDRFTVDGKLYVIPRDIAPVCLVYYNKKAFDEARLPYPKDDWDWNGFLADAKALTKRDAAGRTVQWGFTEDAPRLEPWIYSSGGRWVDDIKNPTRYALDDPAFIQGIQFRADLMLKHKVMPAPANRTAMGDVAATSLFMGGAAAMFFSGIWVTPELQDIKGFDWDCALFPKGPDGRRGFANSGSGYGILASCKHKKEAWEFVKYIAGTEGETKMVSTGLTQPALRSLGASKAFLDGRPPLNKKILLKAVPYGSFDPMAQNWTEILNGIIGPVLDRVWTGTLTAQQAVSQLAEALKSKPLVTRAAK